MTPSVYMYNTATGVLKDKTPDDPLIWETLGLRSAGSLGDVVLLAGFTPLVRPGAPAYNRCRSGGPPGARRWMRGDSGRH